MKILSIIGLFLFLGFSYVQHNDHDWYLWLPLYLSAGLFSFFNFRKQAAVVLIVITVIWGVIIGPGLDWTLADEIFREVGGLLIVFAWAVMIFVISRRASLGKHDTP